MEHLSPESLARLVEEFPGAEELLHLESCAECRAEAAAYRQQTEDLGRLPDLRPPVEDWDILEARLVSEGLVRRRSALPKGLAMTPGWMRAAAACLLFLSGAGVGAGAAHKIATPSGAEDLEPAFVSVASRVSSSSEAAALVGVTERQYMDALLRYHQIVDTESGGSSAVDPESRYAALEYLVAAGQAALRQAPADPFLNGVLASTLAERQAALRRISTARPDNWF